MLNLTIPENELTRSFDARLRKTALESLLASCLRHADGLSRALDARCYEGGEGRTHLREQRLCARDAAAVAATLAFIAAMVALG